VTEQDKAMLEMTETLSRLRAELRKLRERMTDAAAGDGGGQAVDERPPHY